ncbi:hypothetical protein Taro_025323 [Colocasia esculenta]|uniref:SHSP domain-containing protein n=1 Tax=Colocasia esculenta TaxID=4460 RepID=A0A843VH85_COLES|nr:hypothetical protein [Colocasia esculenta]
MRHQRVAQPRRVSGQSSHDTGRKPGNRSGKPKLRGLVLEGQRVYTSTPAGNAWNLRERPSLAPEASRPFPPTTPSLHKGSRSPVLQPHRIPTDRAITNCSALAVVLIAAGKREAMDVRMFGPENPLFSTLHHLMDIPDETDKAFNAPTRAYVRDAKAMAATPADVKEYPDSYAFVVDMPGLKSGGIKVQVEDGNVLVISGERKREDGKYLRMERRVSKFMRKFSLPDNANTDAVSAVYQDGVLTVTVEKLPPPKPKKPKTVEVKIA